MIAETISGKLAKYGNVVDGSIRFTIERIELISTIRIQRELRRERSIRVSPNWRRPWRRLTALPGDHRNSRDFVMPGDACEANCVGKIATQARA
jgi:hypothetical protein